MLRLIIPNTPGGHKWTSYLHNKAFWGEKVGNNLREAERGVWASGVASGRNKENLIPAPRRVIPSSASWLLVGEKGLESYQNAYYKMESDSLLNNFSNTLSL